jgi:hypothetical protein
MNQKSQKAAYASFSDWGKLLHDQVHPERNVFTHRISVWCKSGVGANFIRVALWLLAAGWHNCTEQVGLVVIQEVLGSNLSQDTSCADWEVSWFSVVPPGKKYLGST